MCQLIITRQFLRSTIWPCLAADSSANPHWVGRAWMPSVVFDAIESTPMPYLPAIVMPDGEMLPRRHHRHVLLEGQDLQRASWSVNQSLS